MGVERIEGGWTYGQHEPDVWCFPKCCLVRSDFSQQHRWVTCAELQGGDLSSMDMLSDLSIPLAQSYGGGYAPRLWFDWEINQRVTARSAQHQRRRIVCIFSAFKDTTRNGKCGDRSSGEVTGDATIR